MGEFPPVSLQFVSLRPVDDDRQHERLTVGRYGIRRDFCGKFSALLASHEHIARAAHYRKRVTRTRVDLHGRMDA